jgi:hypothetical protein
MERQLWKAIVAILTGLDKSWVRREGGFSDRRIVEVYYWSVLHDRPVCWAVQRCNWPIELHRWKLPSNTTMSRRLRSEGVRRLLTTLEHRVVRRSEKGTLVWMIVGSDKSLADWRLAPMNVDERKMAKRMLKRAKICGYVVADANYDSNELHSTCDEQGNLQLVTPRRYGPGRGHGHRQQTPGRLRSKEILENPFPAFGNGLMTQRGDIERYFGNLTNWGGGLTHLPPWVRGYRRVYRWVQAKLVVNYIKMDRGAKTYVA